MMKANGFEILLATSLNKFGGSSSILCAFLRRSFLKYLQISDSVTEWVTERDETPISSLVYSIQTPLLGAEF